MSMTADGFIYGRPHQNNTAYGPHGLWYEQDGRENFSKYDRPYSYSPFFILGDHESIKGAHCDYTDRYQLWDREKFDAAIKAVGRQCRWDQMRPAEFNRFAEAYYGKGTRVVGVVEWCNASNGYPCWSLHFTRPEPTP